MLDEVIQLDKKYYLNTFGDRLPVCFEKGEGMYLFENNASVVCMYKMLVSFP